jgi:hypothetical protein
MNCTLRLQLLVRLNNHFLRCLERLSVIDHRRLRLGWAKSFSGLWHYFIFTFQNNELHPLANLYAVLTILTPSCPLCWASYRRVDTQREKSAAHSPAPDLAASSPSRSHTRTVSAAVNTKGLWLRSQPQILSCLIACSFPLVPSFFLGFSRMQTVLGVIGIAIRRALLERGVSRNDVYISCSTMWLCSLLPNQVLRWHGGV